MNIIRRFTRPKLSLNKDGVIFGCCLGQYLLIRFAVSYSLDTPNVYLTSILCNSRNVSVTSFQYLKPSTTQRRSSFSPKNETKRRLRGTC